MSEQGLRKGRPHWGSELSARPENPAVEAFRVEKNDRAANLAALSV